MVAAAENYNTKLPLVTIITNCNFTNNSPTISALITVKVNSKLYIYNSIFENNYSLSRGSVLFADFKNVYIYVNNTLFKSNYAYLGGIFYSH